MISKILVVFMGGPWVLIEFLDSVADWFLTKLRKEMCDEEHRTRYTVYPGSTKMYTNMKRRF